MFDSLANDARLERSLTLQGTHSAICAIPALPGAQNKFRAALEVCCNAQPIACSLPPDPTIRIFIFSYCLKPRVEFLFSRRSPTFPDQMFSAKMLDTAYS